MPPTKQHNNPFRSDEPRPKNAGIGKIVYGSGDDVIGALGLGSCVALILFDPKEQVAALAHVALSDSNNIPKSKAKAPLITPGRYADTAVPACIKRIQRLGGNIKHTGAILLGGSRMFGSRGLFGPGFNIGLKNATALRKLLQEHNIPIYYSDLGGEISRTVRFHISSAELHIKKMDSDNRFIVKKP